MQVGNENTLQEYRQWRAEENLGEVAEEVVKAHERANSALSERFVAFGLFIIALLVAVLQVYPSFPPESHMRKA